MIKKIKISFIITAILIFLPLFSVNAQESQCVGMEEGDECTVGDYSIEYAGLDPITGERKLIAKTVDVGYDPNYIDSPFLTDYLAAMYRYAVIVTTILATIVIIFAGVLWITSAGNTEQIGRAKKMIGRSITGLLLAVGSYTILWTINPQLVEFGSLKILRVANVNIASDESQINQFGSTAGILVVIGGKPSSDFGKKFMENNIPAEIKNSYTIVYANWEDSINDIKAQAEEAKKQTGNKIYLIGFSKGGETVFNLLKSNFQVDAVGLIDPSHYHWREGILPKNTTMIWGSPFSTNSEFKEEYEKIIKEIEENGGRVEKIVTSHAGAVKLYFDVIFLGKKNI
ncbi:MAG: hypothetical protein A2469_03395 [Candidatus Magasanikbacteria bacterium RIFOXYC2_FULL_40_16]|uniref:Alpha/beta hydrolase n=3 Tax=Candidatus Magasanikiibacteriota TaxID=1752731 RepID=A0A1F6NJS5_9BACT|nr:MAG: hypothetical protein A2224_03895 [Candidatus Magasanikbacteria bacterium RIFOXYA2_FULL_40_20]OGH84053.1 MAG: hypothetical protein A2373_03670 [Candidatus Magasanikbacteria bacterium RIFOXYB1_FULL_40_15]OGH86448.1 MAG: hypothetical protein A2301_01090 [Candidatus Magasanikbacteria bacterium RIFOXYB2_FULL_40_13]OGH87227.1 MAG: hypothetical protein A2206_03400 [Candidatus Magasanikbacteria bacterium RIFOXYA1_FULL_40_8]OGH89684.1 MAG: hypothetical protein A2469_03395 [Candidatus Magasanikba